MGNLIGKEVEDFRVQAYCKGGFREVTKADLLGHWSVVFVYPGVFSFVCPTELGALEAY